MSDTVKVLLILGCLVVALACCIGAGIVLFDDGGDDPFLRTSEWCASQHGFGTADYFDCMEGLR